MPKTDESRTTHQKKPFLPSIDEASRRRIPRPFLKRGLAYTMATIWGLIAVVQGSADSPTGANAVADLRSAAFLGGGAFVTTEGNAESSWVNPAAAASQQRITIDGGYTLLAGLGSESGFGHAAAAGVVVPTKYGVFGGTINFWTSPFSTSLPLGTRGGISGFASKVLYPWLSVGAAVEGSFGTDWSAALDLGAQGHLGDISFLKDFRWGATLSGLGAGDIPSPFTLSAGAAFGLLRTDTFDLDAAAELSFPTFSNVAGKLGFEARVARIANIGLYTGFNLRESLDGNGPSVIPGLALSASFSMGGSKAKSTGGAALDSAAQKKGEITTTLGVKPLYGDVWGFGTSAVATLGVLDKEAPVIRIDYPGTFWMSPNNDGKADYLEFPITISDRRYVASWRFVVVNASDVVVRELRNKELRPETSGFEGVMDKLLYVASGVEIPSSIRWDGMTDAGTVAQDGVYRFRIEATDDNGNTAVSPYYEIVVDSTPPSVNASPSTKGTGEETEGPRIFSPDGDGAKDTFSIDQDGSQEDMWTAQMTDGSGNVVRSWKIENGKPARVVWDGKDDVGNIVPDGVYGYRIHATDKALNEGSARIDNIIVNTEKPTVSLIIDEGWISPNGDGIKDVLHLTPVILVPDGLVSWTLRVLDKGDTPRKTWNGDRTNIVEQAFVGREDSGSKLTDGTYHGELIARYENGYEAKALSPSFVLDTVKPTIQVLVPGSATLRTFSPDGDGKKDSIHVVQGGSREDLWTASFNDAAGKTVRSYEWSNVEPTEFDWDGSDDLGRRVQDGIYSYHITSRDKAGNSASAVLDDIIVDTSRPDAALAVSDKAFSPNGDAEKDLLTLLPTVGAPGAVDNWTLRIVDEGGSTRRDYSGSGTPPAKIEFDGRTGGFSGTTLREGIYKGVLTVLYKNGWTPETSSPSFELDLTKPSAEVAVQTPAFSPNGDGNLDEAIFTQKVVGKDTWRGEILKDGKVVRTISFEGTPPEKASWDGLDDAGALAPDGTYDYRLAAVDAAGNVGISVAVPFELTTANTPVLLTADLRAFSPNGDGIKDGVTLTGQLKVTEGVSSWKLDIIDSKATVVRSFEGQGSAPAPVSWNGKAARGEIAPDGAYTARMEIQYAMGNRPVANSAPFVLDTQAPKISLVGDTLIFSPNGDGVKDLAEFTRTVEGNDPWTAEIMNGHGEALRSWTWKGESGPFSWDGKDEAGNIVLDGTYSLLASSRDEAGNFASASIQGIRIDTEAPQGSFSIADPAFSPNKDGRKDSLEVTADTAGDDSWNAVITDQAGVVVKTWTWKGAAPKLIWDGLDPARKLAAEGLYDFAARSGDAAGNTSVAEMKGIVLDITPPALTLSVPYQLFSPEGDGRKDTLPIDLDTPGDELWRTSVLDSTGAELARWNWRGKAPKIAWDGKDAAGNVTPDGEYRIYLVSEDAAGNRTERTMNNIVVDKRSTRVFLTASAQGLSPNGDGIADDVKFGIFVNLKEGMESWKLDIMDESGTVRRSLGPADAPGSTASAPPQSITWNGRETDGSVREGKRTAKLSIQYLKGDLATAVAGPLLVDITPPTLAVDTKPRYFSPDNDGVDDELAVALSAKDASALDSWVFEVKEPQPPALSFFRIEGKGAPTERFVWDGRSNKGELVQAATDYPYIFTAVDALGNAAKVEGIAGVDVLVIKEGDSLKIKVPSIIFRENEADFLGLATDTVDNNTRVLRRIAQILNKFKDYKVIIEGHANNVTGTEKEETQELLPLSRKRADAVKAILVSFGVDAQRLSTVGVGGRKPVVPRNDRDNWWKNRRVEFILVK